VVCRAGAITLAELAILGKPCILIPSPNVTDNHQYKNAKVYEDCGAAVLIEEKDLTAEKMMETVRSLLNSPEKLRSMGEKMKTLAKVGAEEIIWKEICSITK